MNKPKNTREEGIALAKEFVEKVLSKEKWFSNLEKKNLCDLLLLTGSVVQGGKDHLSDMDLFLVAPLKIQKKMNLPPVYEYTYKGIKIEISNATTEKLISDQIIKDRTHWWQDSVIIKGNKQKFLPILKKAGSYSKKEKKEKLWTLMALFEMNITDLERIIERQDTISFELNFWDCIKMFCEFMLLLKNIQRRLKWYGKLIEQHYPKINTELLQITNKTTLVEKLNGLKSLRTHFKNQLILKGFTKKEIENWHEHNLAYLIFQKQ